MASRLLSTQRAINSHLAALEPPEELIPGVLRAVCETLGCSLGAFWEPDDDDRTLRFVTAWHEPREELAAFASACGEITFSKGDPMLGSVWESAEPAWVPTLRRDSSPRSALAEAADLRTELAVPLVIGDRVSGILEFFSDGEHEPEPDLIDGFQVVSLQLAQYLDRWQTHQALERWQEGARQVVESLAAGIMVVDADGKLVSYNNIAQELLGFEPGARVGMSGLVTPADGVYYEDGTPVSADRSPIRDTLIGRKPRLGVQIRADRDGDSSWYELNVRPLPNGGAVASVVDVTARRAVEQEQQRLAQIVETTDDAVFSKDLELNIMTWNAGAERLYGHSAEEAIGRPISIIIPEHLRGEEAEILDRVLHEQEVRHYETERVRKDGSLVDVALTVSPLRNDHGDVLGASVIARDITQRKRADRALVEARDRAERYLNMAGSIIVAVGPDERATMINRTGLEVFGRSEEEMLSSNWFDLVFPDDIREDLRAAFRALLDEGVIDQGSLGYYETPVVTAAGERRTVAWMSSLLEDAPGHVVGILSSGADITERLESEAAVAHLAYHDQLTGLPNRALLEEHLEIALARATREKWELALLYLDLDNFKMVNDSLGHAAGDRLLEMVAERLSHITRGTDLVARHGGDEFLILLTELDGGAVPVAETVATKILTALEDPFKIGDAEFEIGGSVGIAIFPRDGQSGSTLLRAADSAMYQAKAAGRSRYAVHRFTGGEQRDLLSTTARLRRALTNDEFVLHYQPIFTVPDRRLSAVEALVRWNDPERGLVGPGDFIQLAEDTGLIEGLGNWVIGAICRQAVEWTKAGLEPRIHFNLSPRQLRQRGVASAIREVVAQEGVHSDLLTAEVTESAAMAEAESGASVLGELRDMGLHVAVDDFGSGYSSLGRLRSLPVDELKLDRSFLRGVPQDAEAGTLVRAVIDLANGLGMRTVVEGVETPDQWRFLSAHERLLAQGFHLARPAPAEATTQMLRAAQQAQAA